MEASSATRGFATDRIDSKGARLRLLLAERSALLREALGAALSEAPEIEIDAEASDLRSAVDVAVASPPDVAVIGTTMTEPQELSEIVRELRERLPGCPLVLLDDAEDYDNLVAGIEAGISGYVTKKAPLSELIDVLLAVRDGEAVVPGRMLKELLDRLISARVEKDRALKRVGRLTKRERQVLALLVQGGDNDKIAQELVISPQTARTHIQNILQKLETNSRLQAAAFIVQHDLLDELMSEQE